MKPFDVKITRSEKRGRKIILVIESDIYSNEPFAASPFRNEGPEKDQLQALRLNLSIQEQAGVIEADVTFDSCLNHYTKGHSQLHSPLNTFYSKHKDCALNWIITEKEEFFKEDRINSILKKWKNDIEFSSALNLELDKRRNEFKIKKIKLAKNNYQNALKELELALEL